MEQYYMNGPSNGAAMAAEEYTAALQTQNSCGCGNCPTTAANGCGCQKLVCCCRPAEPCPKPIEVDEGCCCKQSFRAALQLLCDQELSDLLDFDATVFVTNDYSAGAAVTQTVADAAPADNLTEPLEGTFLRFSPGSCDLLDIDAELFAAPETSTGLTATQVNLCELVAFVIQLAETEAEGDLTAEQVAARNFRRVRAILSRSLTPCSNGCGSTCSCPVCDDCCCAAGLLATLAESNLSRRVSLAAGPLLLNGVTLLGTAGNVLVLANDEDYRIYFVCVNHIQFLA